MARFCDEMGKKWKELPDDPSETTEQGSEATEK